MAEAIKPYDAANYLRDEEDIAAYLEVAAEDGDPVAMAMALGAVARARNMAQLARDTGITREGLYKALSPGGNPQFSTVVKVAGALGFPLVFQMPPPPKLVQAPKPASYTLARRRCLEKRSTYQRTGSHAAAAVSA